MESTGFNRWKHALAGPLVSGGGGREGVREGAILASAFQVPFRALLYLSLSLSLYLYLSIFLSISLFLYPSLLLLSPSLDSLLISLVYPLSLSLSLSLPLFFSGPFSSSSISLIETPLAITVEHVITSSHRCANKNSKKT